MAEREESSPALEAHGSDEGPPSKRQRGFIARQVTISMKIVQLNLTVSRRHVNTVVKRRQGVMKISHVDYASLSDFSANLPSEKQRGTFVRPLREWSSNILTSAETRLHWE